MDEPLANSVARKINREAVVLLGWGRAILLQLAHPLVAAAVADYSHFDKTAGGYVRRVRQTVGGMLTITFGSPDEARAVVERINQIHRHVRGTLDAPVGPFPAGTPYAATDPTLLCWVHATLVDSMVEVYERLVAPLTPEERDRFCVEAAETGRVLGIPDALLPKRFVDLRRYLEQMYAGGAIAVGPNARALAGALMSPPLGPAAVPLFRVTRLVTIGLLPDGIRRAYGFSWDAGRDRTFRAIMGLIRRVRSALPARLREWPAARAA
jgi:uncharacterized protein (DUF2236 family)